MITRASRLFFGLAGVSYVLAVLYGIATEASKVGAVGDTLGGDGAVNAVLGPLTLGYKGGVGEHVGFVTLMAFAAASLLMGVVSSAFRDGDPEAIAELMSLDAAPAVTAPLDVSAWPAVAAVGAAVAAIGLAGTPALFVAGVALMVASGAEWAIKDWSERATADPEVNRAIRNRMMYPVEFPLAGVVLLGFMALGFSRLLLNSSETMAIVWALVFAAVIFTAAIVINALNGEARKMAVSAALVVGFIAVLGTAIYGAARGERDFEVHENDGGTEHGSVIVTPSSPLGDSA